MKINIIERTVSTSAQPLPHHALHFSSSGHEQIAYFCHQPTGLQAIIAIHDTTLGPGLGGLRFLAYPHEQAALQDVLRLSEGMTYKAAIAGLDVGGGKAVLVKQAGASLTEPLLRQFGHCVEKLHGQYITAPDVNTTIDDMVQISKSTRHVVSLPTALGGSGDPSENTAYGVYVSMKAAVKKVFGTDSLAGRKIAIEGVGKVGYWLANLLCQEQAMVYVADVCQQQLDKLVAVCPVKVVSPQELYHLPLDIYAPCALGATLNAETIPKLNCAIIVGAANNQLADATMDSQLLMKKKICYVPDFLANAGGLMNAVTELQKGGWAKNWVKQQTEQLYAICLNLLYQAEETGRPVHDLAIALAQERIHNMKNVWRR